MKKNIPLIDKSAAIIQLEVLKLYVKDIWPIVNDAQLPIYLDSTSAQFIPFHSFSRLLQAAFEHLTPKAFIEFIHCGAGRYLQHIEGISAPDKVKGTFPRLVNSLPIQEIELASHGKDAFLSKYTLNMKLENIESYTFVNELYLISVAHRCLIHQYPELKAPFKYHLISQDTVGLDKLKISMETPQFMGQESTKLYYQSSTLQGCDISQRYWKKQQQDFTTQVLNALESYIGRQDVSLETFSQIVGIPVRTIQRYLGSENQTFRKIKESLNMAFAKRVMVEREASISDIAEHLGYADTSQFIRAFKKSEQLTPLQWRKKACNTLSQ